MSTNAPLGNAPPVSGPPAPPPPTISLSADDLLKAIVEEAQRLRDDARFSHAAHNAEGRRYERRHSYLGILTVVLAAGAGLVSGLGTFLDGRATGIISALVSFFAATVAGLVTWLDPKAKAAEQVAAAVRYAGLEGEARRFAEIECKTGRPVEELKAELKQLISRCEAIDDQTPNFSEWAIRRAEADIGAGLYP